MLLVLLLVLTVWAADGKQLDNKMGKVSDRCVSAMASCSNRVLSAGRCRTVWNSLALQMIRSDMDNNCEVDDDDFEHYLEINFDTNDDDHLCLNEWLHYMMNNFGYTKEAATGIFQNKFKNMIKSNCVDIEDVLPDSDMRLKTEYLNHLMEDLAAFCSTKNNINTNRDCWGLVSECKTMAKNMEACQKLDLSNVKTLYEKLVLEHQTSDSDNNGLVTKSEYNSDLLNNYDSDRNGCISKVEWVNRLMSFFDFTRKFAGYVYDSFDDVNRDKCINIGHFVFPPNGMSQNTRLGTFMKKLIEMCEKETSLYTENQDCAAVADTCNLHFDHLPECSSYYKDTCGLEAYSLCVSRLNSTSRNGRCTSVADKFEVKFEGLKIGNQINEACEANNINKNTGSMPSASPFFLFFIIVVLVTISQ